MLHVFFKFGRPVEDDALNLFRNKLKALYQNDNDSQVAIERRQRAVDEIVNWRIEIIVRTMTSYNTNIHNQSSTVHEHSSTNPSNSDTRQTLVTS